MRRIVGWLRSTGLVLIGGSLLAAGGCLPPNYYSTLLGDTIVPSITSAVLNTMLVNAGLQP